ncbi:MAG: hypothetical protein ABSC48_16805 [Terracidiphilus sp.]
MNAIPDWEQLLEERLPLFGHRNWIVIADAAYPSQSRPGIETVASGLSQQVTIERVLARLRDCRHVRPNVHVDRELEFVEERDAPGIEGYCQWLKSELKGLDVNSAAHEEIIAKLDRAAQMFSILIVKSTMTIPYTSVFIELDCGYWDGEREARLRSAIEDGKGSS